MFLTRGPVLIMLFLVMVGVGALFYVLTPYVGGALLDMEADPEAIAVSLSEMTAAQKRAHIWVTAGVDTAYPLAYGSLFAGLALRAFGDGLWGIAALPALLGVAADFAENVVQILLLLDVYSVLEVKAWLTPLKFGLVYFSAGLALIGLIWMTVRMIGRLRAG